MPRWLLGLVAAGCGSSPPEPDASPPDPFLVARPCIHVVAGGELLDGAWDEIFVGHACEGGTIVEYVIRDSTGMVGIMARRDWNDRLARVSLVPTKLDDKLAVLAGVALLWNGGFVRLFPPERPYTDLVVADVDGDGARDLVLPGDNAIRRAPNDQDLPIGWSASAETELVGGKPYVRVAVADLGGSALPDLFYVAADGELGVAIQTTPAVFALQPLGVDLAEREPQAPVVADVDGDGRADVVGLAERFYVFGSRTGELAFLDDAVEAFAVGDFDASGSATPVYIPSDRSGVRRVQIMADGTLASEPLIPGGGDTLIVSDTDGDLRDDLVVVHDLGLPTSWLYVHRAPTFWRASQPAP